MLPQWLHELEIPQFTGWTIPVAGALAAGLAYAAGSLFFGRRKSLPPPAGETAPAVRLPQGPTDRRSSYRRQGTDVEVHITDAEVKTHPVHGWVVDRSVCGLCLRAPASFAVGTILSLRPCKAPGVVPWVQVEVKNCRQQENSWEVGCQFLRTPPYNVLLLFG